MSNAKWIKDALEAVRKRPVELSTYLGIAAPRVHEMIKGVRRLQLEEIGGAAEFLRLPEEAVKALMKGAPFDTVDRTATDTPWVNNDGRSIPIRRVIVDGDKWKMDGTNAGVVSRPDYLRFSKSAFAVVVQDEANSPVYRIGDRILIDPDAPKPEGADYIFCTCPDADSRELSTCYAGNLVRATANTFLIRQYGGAEKRLSRKQYPSYWRITGRHMQP